MSQEIIVKTYNAISLQDYKVLAVRVIGATLNHNIENLYEFFKNYEKNAEVSFLILTGIFHLLSEDESLDKTLDQLDYFAHGYQSPQKKLKVFLERFDQILCEQDYSSYPIAVIPDSGITKEVFLGESFIGILKKLSRTLFSGSFSRYNRGGNDVFIISDNIKILFKIILKLGLLDDNTFSKALSSAVCESLDTVFTRSFSSSKTTVWNARRASLEYFIKQLYIFNKNVPKKIQKSLFKRWEAWFILEDRYKMENKKVHRKKLQDEMLEIFNRI